MSEEDDCIVLSVGDDDSNDDDDDIEVVVIRDTGTDLAEDSFSDDEVLVILTNSEDDSDDPGESPELSCEMEDFTALNSQVVSCLASLKRGNPDSEEVESMPLYKRGRPSIPEDNCMENNAPEDLFHGNHRNLLAELQRYCQNLNELAEIISSQINHLRGIVSEMQHSLGRPQTLPCGDSNPPSPAERQENDAETNPGGASLQSAACPELQQLAPSESPSLPRIVSTYSLQPSHDSDSPFPRLTLSPIFSEGDEHINSDLSSAQDPLAEPIADLPQAESSLPDNFETVRYSTINNRMNPDTALPSLCIAPNFEVAETSLENNPETMSYSTLSGNDSGLSSLSVNLPPNFGVEKFILTQMPIKEETGVENSSQTVYYPALLGNIDPSTDSSSHSVPPNFAFEKIILLEMPGQAEITMDNSYQIVGNETVMGNETEVGNDSNPDTGSSPLSIPPSVEMVVKSETSLESDTPVMNQSPFLKYDSDEDASYIFIRSDVESGIEMSSEAEDHASVIKNDSDQQIDSESFFLTSGFALLPVKVLVKEENSTKNRPETMNHPIVLGNDNSEASSLSPVLMPSNFGYLGDPRRNIRMLDIHLMAVQKKAIPRHAACYLVHSLFSKEILISSSVGISSQGCQSLDPNKMAAIREHLAAVFPNYDLSEHGEEWQACISDINSLIHNLRSRTPKTVLNNGGPTKPKRDWNDKRDGDDNASSSWVSQQAAISETREQGNSPQNSRALPEGIQEPSTDGAAVSDETLEYLGDPRRNIQMPKSLLITAKEKSRPELSAMYLIRRLFTDEVLMSSVRGSLGIGVYSLDTNEINALREFLQDIYPTCDLSENGYNWKLCVMAINSCIHSLRCDPQRSTAASQSPPATTPSTESKPKDTDLAD
ncbi:BEN domain-containing protein 2 isoform X1 [Odocoileus virginianus]|uniref:BEN domain-containing protein 2 isoform X1 n=1 Tax=Odocoileus virginianus TaxID=9874 RepID=A0A6J0YH53_ODOVR|nr:BEN domain-containing protein 2 isoform X1 [Odocoileus virginianus texanus]